MKKGVSDVVATVLIIALTILAISILWVGVIPLVKNNLGVNDICSSVDISISTSQGYTCYQPNEITSVQINKGAKESNISGLKFYLLSNGNSIQYSKDIALGKNTFTSFFLNSSAISKVEKLQVVPVVKNGNVVKDCPATYISSVSTCGSIGFSAAEIAQAIDPVNVSRDNTYPLFSNYQDNNATLLDSGLGLFNVTVVNTNWTVLLEINNTNVTANSLGNGIYSASYSVSNGTYSYRWYSYGNGSNNNLGVSSSRNYVVYKAGKALSFNGNSQYVNLGDSSPVRITGNITLSAWIKMAQIPAGSVQYSIMAKTENGAYGLYADSPSMGTGKIVTYFYIAGAYRNVGIGIGNFSAGIWYYITASYNGSSVNFYVNGVLRDSLSGITGPISSTNGYNLAIGADPSTPGVYDAFFNGSIDEVLIFNRSLSSAEVSQLYNNGIGLRADTSIAPFNSGLVSAYHFDEGSGSIAYDITGINNGTIINGPQWVTGKVGI